MDVVGGRYQRLFVVVEDGDDGSLSCFTLPSAVESSKRMDGSPGPQIP